MLPKLYLASRSPRRAELLRLLGVDFAVLDVDIDETVAAGEAPADYVTRLARAKARSAQQQVVANAAVLAADTTVSIDGDIFGKPSDEAQARAMLARLSGRWHEVYTAVALAQGADLALKVVRTRVEFRMVADHMLGAYWRSGEPADKAGGYGIQGLGGAFVRRIEGSYSAVVGLPLCETAELLEQAGISHALVD